MRNIKRHKQVFIIAILFLAAFLRLYNISAAMVFLGDEGRDVLVAYNILHGHLTLLGPTSSVGGFFLGPVYYYFMVPFLLLFNYDPVGPAVMIALFGILTVYIVYRIGKEFFSETAGIVASLLYAVSPLVIIYSRSSWNPNLMPISTLLCLYFLYKGVEKKKSKYLLLSGFIFGLILQFHYLGTFVGMIIFVYVTLGILIFDNTPLVGKLKQFIKAAIILFAGFLIGFSPFIVFEARHGFKNFQNIYQFVFYSKDTGGGHFFTTIGDIFFRTFGRLITAFPVPVDFHKFNPYILQLWQLITVFLAVFSIILLYKMKNKLQALLLLTWIFIGIFLFGFYKKPIYDYYLEFLFPLPFLLVGNFVSVLYHALHEQKLRKISVVLCVGFLTLFNLYFANPIGAPANNQKDQAKTIADFVLVKANKQPFNFALITGGNSDHAYRYYMTVEGHPPTTIENAQNDPRRSTVTDQLFIVCESLPCFPLGNPLFEIAGFGQADIVGKWNVSVVEIYKLVHHKQ